MSVRSCVFSFDMICEAANVSVSEEEAANASGPFYLCSHHYYDTYSHCRSVSECALCGSTSRHRAGDEKHLRLRYLPQPESIQAILDETGNCVLIQRVLCAIAVIYLVRSCWSTMERIYAPLRASCRH